ncbi:MAG: MFS transporter [Gammaproteobacteria bacterium]|nr:MFS transporter [Gammaproteobacteria bacterium]MCY3987664.1 MFS transporter [Gammaproteobacteria bacterium]
METTNSPTHDSARADGALPQSLRMNFGAGAMGMAVILNTMGGVFPPFMTNFLGIGAGAAATLLLVSKLYDMVTDPLMGVISDRASTRWGRRRPFLVLGGAISAIGLVLVFNPPAIGSQAWLIAFVLGALLVTYTGYTVFNIPYMAMPAEMTGSYHERTTLMSHRVVFLNIGALIAVSAFAIVQWLGNDRAAHGTMGLAFAMLIFLGSAYCFFGTAAARQTFQKEHAHSIGTQIRTAFGNRPLMLLLGAKFCQLLGVSLSSATGVYFKVVILGLSYQLTTLYLYTSSLVIIAFIPVWNMASRRYGKRLTYMAASAGYALVTLTWLLATADDPLSYVFIRAVLLGICASGILILGAALLPDAVEYDYLKTGMRREGTLSSFYSTVEKLAFAVGPALALYFLGWFGYQAGTEGMRIEQPQSAIIAIYIGAGLTPAALYGLSLVFLFKYDLSEDRLEALRGRPPGSIPEPSG